MLGGMFDKSKHFILYNEFIIKENYTSIDLHKLYKDESIDLVFSAIEYLK